MNNVFDQIPFFAISKMGQNQFFETAKNAISRKNILDLFNFTSFFNFLARSVVLFTIHLKIRNFYDWSLSQPSKAKTNVHTTFWGQPATTIYKS